MNNKVGQFEKVSYYEGDVKLPTRATTGSAGYDFFAPRDIRLAPGENDLIVTNIRCKICDGWMLALFPRSGLGFKNFMRLANTVGIVDCDFYFADNEGNIAIKIRNEGDAELFIPEGKAFCQGIFIPFGVTFDDNATETRHGGFGSTDKN